MELDNVDRLMHPEDPETHKKIIIEGITEDGKRFRPSDWAERVSERLSTFENGRFCYSPMLKPIIQNNYKCIMLDPLLKTSNPELYAEILNFAKQNHLKICDTD